MDILHTIDLADWDGPFSAAMRADACEALERGKVLFLPHLNFRLSEFEGALLTPEVSDGKAKNVSLKPSGKMGGTSCRGEKARLLHQMMERFAETAMRFLGELIPAYAGCLERAPTSYRPVEIAGRPASAVYDDTRLHVDAFPSRPMRGRRILRLFSNINPDGAPRIWHVGEPFEDMAERFLPAAREGSHLQARIFGALGITKGARSPYDGLMLGLHDGAKLDEDYQLRSPQAEIPFPAGSTWICYTDQVMHAALKGQFVLEQTFHLDVESMETPARSPLRILERLRGRALV
ncbi:MAG TPA: Kdo hydroxylase family protein [Rhizomicrobium sp.]|nr:Kdo hydroxylase family protein [Rhizomicrobium sp.]